MSLDGKTLKEFANLVDDSNKEPPLIQIIGTVYSVNGTGKETEIMVQLDGTDSPTPVYSVMDGAATAVGDRVIVLLQGRTATIIGNYNAPSASAGRETKFIHFYEGTGLVIAEDYDWKSSENHGRNILISSDRLSFRNGEVELAYIMDDTIVLGNVLNKNLLLDQNGVKIRDQQTALATFTEDGLQLDNGASLLKSGNDLLLSSTKDFIINSGMATLKLTSSGLTIGLGSGKQFSFNNSGILSFDATAIKGLSKGFTTGNHTFEKFEVEHGKTKVLTYEFSTNGKTVLGVTGYNLNKETGVLRNLNLVALEINTNVSSSTYDYKIYAQVSNTGTSDQVGSLYVYYSLCE